MKGRLHTVVAGGLLGFMLLTWAGSVAASLACGRCHDAPEAAANTTACQWMTPTSCCDQVWVSQTLPDVVGPAITIPASRTLREPSPLSERPPALNSSIASLTSPETWSRKALSCRRTSSALRPLTCWCCWRS